MQGLLAVLTLAFLFCSAAEENCAAVASAGDCDFYVCVDRLLGGCGSEGYPLGFGYKYCRRFQESKGLFDFEVCI